MLISEIMEKAGATTAADNMANHLADRVRNIWLKNRNAGVDQWEENFYEAPDGVSFLRSESFPNLVGMDYIFKWWGNADLEGLAGELEVLWKVDENGEVDIFKTWIRFADRDFVIGTVREESAKREVNRRDFRAAFAQWQKLYANRQK